MKKIALIVEHYYPLVSGVPFVMKYMAEGLAKAGFLVDVFTSGYNKQGQMPKKDVLNSININRYYLKYNLLYFITGKRGEKRRFLKDILNNYDFYILTCSQCWTTDILLKKIKKIRGKIVFYPHGYSGLNFRIDSINQYGFKRFISSIYRKVWAILYYKKLPKYLRLMDAIIYISKYDSAKKFGEKYNLLNEYVIENAVEDIFFVLPKQKDCKKYILNVSNYTHVKNQAALLKSFYLANTEEFGLMLIGREKNDYYDSLIALNDNLAKQFGNKDVSILASITRENIRQYIVNSTIYAMTSRWEEYSISLCEAMACGIPFISTRVGNAEFLPGGIIVDDERQLVKAIEKMVSDSNFRDDLAKQGRDYAVAHNTISVAVDKFITILNKINEN